MKTWWKLQLLGSEETDKEPSWFSALVDLTAGGGRLEETLCSNKGKAPLTGGMARGGSFVLCLTRVHSEQDGFGPSIESHRDDPLSVQVLFTPIRS